MKARLRDTVAGGDAMTERCTYCHTPVAFTPDWTLWPWPDGANLCASCNDKRHELEEYDEVERRCR